VAFGLLGPVEVRVDGRPVAVGGPHARSIVAALLLEAGKVVPIERLVDAAWGESPPPSAQIQVRNRVGEVRRALSAAGADGVIDTRGSGYTVHVGPDQLDTDRFERLVAGSDALRPAEAIDGLEQALALWRGAPLDGLRTPLLAAAARRLDERRVAALSRRCELLLRSGRHEEVLGELLELAAAYPANEAIAGQVMTALYLAGRQGEALAHFGSLRRTLAEELGIDPGPALVALRDAILRNDLAPPLLRSAAVARQLPSGVRAFTGREAELDALDQALSDGVGVAVVAGTAGVGKTSLTVHWGHRVAARFPDGQLYVNLRGYHAGTPVAPAAALSHLLRSLGTPPQRVPADVDTASALLRSVLAERRVLLVLDNARTEDQVRPLLPGTDGAFAVITSRSGLPGLIAAEGARLVRVDLPTPPQAQQMLLRRLGATCGGAERIVAEIVELCARLPLAIAIVAARAVALPEPALPEIAVQLRESGRLDSFAIEDTTTDVRSVFSWSYRSLDTGAARMFRLLGLHPGPEISVAAAASLAGASEAAARAMLGTLTRAHLAAEPSPGRFTLHDLLRAYAAELAAETDPTAARWAATRRLLDYLVHTGHSAARLLSPHQDAPERPAAAPGAIVAALPDNDSALRWFAAERTAMVAAVDLARSGFDEHCWLLAWNLETYLDYHGQWADQETLWQAGLAAATRLGDRSKQARAHRGLGLLRIRMKRFAEAHESLREALARYADDPIGQAHTLRAVNWLHGIEDRHRDALDCALRAYALFRAAGDTYGQARSLNSAGWSHIRLGEYTEATGCCERAIALHQEIRDEYGEAAAWDTLGEACHHTKDFPRAVDCFARSLALTRRLGSRYNEANVLANLAEAQAAGGDETAAREALTAALAILDDLGHPDAERVRARLAAAG
jgi:DNA-binding SARP family transcriptional activator